MDDQKLFQVLFEKYDSLSLSRKNAAKVLGISIPTLDRMRYDGVGPSYQTEGNTRNASVKYPIHEIVAYIKARTIQCV